MRGWPFVVACGMAASACAAIAGLGDPTSVAEVPDAATNESDAPAGDVNDRADTAPPIDANDGGADANPCNDPDLLAYWKIDEGSGTSVADCSRYGHNGTIVGDPTWTGGADGGNASLSFTFEDSVDFGNPTALRVTGALSVTAWVYTRTVTNAGRILTKSGGPGDRGWELNFESDARLRFRVATGTDTTVEAYITPFTALNAWKHFAGVFEPGVSIRLYVDGVQVGIDTNAIPLTHRDTVQSVRIGRRHDCCSFDGMIDDVRVYGRALGEAEVKAIAAR
jgi:hypothetical protein